MEQHPNPDDRDPIPLGDALKKFLDDQIQLTEQQQNETAVERLRGLLERREAGEEISPEELNAAREAAARERTEGQ